MLAKQEHLLELCKEILGEDYLYLEVLRYDAHEDFVTGESAVRCDVRDQLTNEEFLIEGSGVGAVDAFFHGLKDYYAKEHLSLDTVRVHDFRVGAKMESRQREDGADAAAEVTIDVQNSYGKLFRFSHTSRSVLLSALNATLDVVEYFVNSERAIIRLHNAIQHARDEGRSDTVADYTGKLTDLVENTSYTEVIERIRSTVI